MKAIKKYFVASLATLAILATSLAGIFFNTPVKTLAEDSDFTKIVLSEELAKIDYTEEELTASGWDGSTNNASKKSLYKLAFEKSAVNYYITSNYESYKQYEFWTKAHDGSYKYVYKYTNVNKKFAICDSMSEGSLNQKRITSDGNMGIYTRASAYKFYHSFGYVVPSDGVITIPEHTLTITDFEKMASAFYLGFSIGEASRAKIDPQDASLNFVKYDQKQAYTIEKQTFTVTAGQVLYIDMYTDISADGYGISHITYDPIWYFGAEEWGKDEEPEGIQKTFVIDFEDDSDLSLIASNADDKWVWQESISSEQAHGGSRSYKITPRLQGVWPNVVFGSKNANYHDLTKVESFSVWVYFDSDLSESVSNLGIKVCNHNASGGEIQEQKYEKAYTIPSKTWTQITLDVADLKSTSIDLTQAYVKFANLDSNYESLDRSPFYLDDFVVTYYELEEEIDYNQTFTFAEAVGAISYTEEELAATGMTLSVGVLGGATSSLSAENLAKKETFYKTAYGRSPLKYYVAYKDAYQAKEYWQWAVDKSNSWKFSWAHIGGLSAGHSGTTDPRINAGPNHNFYSTADYSYVYSFVYVAPVDGTLTISEHT